MRRRNVGKCTLSFGLGLLAGIILPESWVAVVAVIILVAAMVTTSCCGHRC